jgi:deazaflavin-dependent oxidoreductase (nitroreductase family)
MHFPRVVRRINRVVTNPIMGMFAGVVPPLAILHHVGRKSGRAYRTPVVAFPTKTGFIVPMTYGRDVDWAQNISAAGRAEIERAGQRVPVRGPRVLGSGAAAPHLPVLVRAALRAANLPGYMLLERGTAASRRFASKR